MGIGALFTLLFVAALFSTMFWLISRMPGDAPAVPARSESPAGDSVAA